MKLIYVAGPYRAASEWQLVQNIRRAEALALEVWHLGHACICPHKNTALLGGAADDSLWLEGDLEMMRRCDAVICTDDWQRSEGARNEVAEAKRLGIPVFLTIDELKIWTGAQAVAAASTACG
jgi:hypothetical protein